MCLTLAGFLLFIAWALADHRRLPRVLTSAAAPTLGVLLMLYGIFSFAKSRSFLRETREMVAAAAAVDWADGGPALDKIARLDPVLARLKTMDAYRRSGVTLAMGAAVGSEDLYAPTLTAYVSTLERAMVLPCARRLEAKLDGVTADTYGPSRLALKTYLMMSDVEHLDVAWETDALTSAWEQVLRTSTGIAEPDRRARLKPHVQYYLELLKAKQATPRMPDGDIVLRAQRALRAVPATERYANLFIGALIQERYDEAAEDNRANRKYPPLSLADIFADRPMVLEVIQSARHQKEKRWQEVEGQYTEKGRYAVLANLADGPGLLERERWLVPQDPDETPDQMKLAMQALHDDYERRYAAQWEGLLSDLTVRAPTTRGEAIALYKTLTRPEWPYLRILRTLSDHTGERAGAWESPYRREDWLAFQVREATRREREGALGRFAGVVAFAFPKDGYRLDVESPLARYISILRSLRQDLERTAEATPEADRRAMRQRLEEARRDTSALLDPLDDDARRVLSPLLLSPLGGGER